MPRIVLLAAREEGYRSLMRLSSRAFLETPSTEKPHLKLAWLAGETDGLIALSGGPSGPLDTAIVAGQTELAASRCDAMRGLFGDRLYIELQRHGTAAERAANDRLDAGRRHFFGEFEPTEHVVGVGQGQRRLIIGLGVFGELDDRQRAFKQRIGGMDVQVHEAGIGAHGLPR